jgi:hypothetical protein
MRLLTIGMILIFCKYIYAVAPLLSQKYKHALITGDYGILSEADLWYAENHPSRHYITTKVFWRCVRRGAVEAVLSENFESANQFPPHDNASELKFIFNNSEFNNDTGKTELVYYDYYVNLAHADPVSTNKSIMRRFEKIVGQQKYICFLGRNELEDSIIYEDTYEPDPKDSRNKKLSTRIVKKTLELIGIKTKLGCMRYDCNEPYKMFSKRSQHTN